ncbi:putative membrane protein [Caldicoprobacter guelmensis]|uniref:DUF2273 domain-containing protein n=1 Tax=Caldicoprobacter guelmensis TaxID=1170224 RepID=UPI0019594638|nr:DUF2273 domain-containing protein [Caldicoprobacter guelmensis]MBM7581292.1 putative membrane protein [Caldicoprobacter guelmensis]
MQREEMSVFFKSNKGKIIGVAVGLLFGVLVLVVGFWRSLFLAICIGIGYLIGSVYDGGSKLRMFLKKMFSNDLM